MNPPHLTHLTLVGLGLIGGSFAMAARAAFPQLVLTAVDPNAESLQTALKSQLINHAYVNGDEWLATLPNTLPPTTNEPPTHWIVLATHLEANQAWLQHLAPVVVGRGVMLSDLGSCKRAMTALGQELLPQQFLGAHPMAGRETQGLASATELLFAGKRMLLTPHDAEAQTSLIDTISSLVKAMGMHPTCLEAEAHDKAMAYVSHLPQLYAVALTNLIARHEPARLLRYHGGGIDDQLRLAASSAAMWSPIYQQNADNMGAVLDELIEVLSELREALPDPQRMAEGFAVSNRLHHTFTRLKQAQHRPPQGQLL
jgi:prephenate dehydrogenase